MLNYSQFFEASISDWKELKNLSFWKGLSNVDRQILFRNNVDEKLLVKKVSKTFATNFLNRKEVPPFWIFYVIKGRLAYFSHNKSNSETLPKIVGLDLENITIDGESLEQYLDDKLNKRAVYYAQDVVKVATEIYMAYSESDAPKNYEVKKVNVDKTLKRVWEDKFKEMLESFATDIIQTLNEEGIEIDGYETSTEYNGYIKLHLENNGTMFIYKNDYSIDFANTIKRGKTDKLDLKNLVQMLKR